MSQAFVIMQIGNPELDHLYDLAIFPAIKKCGLEAKRVDKHNEGGLLKSEIIGFIENSDIIIADLTSERANCYLEVGYAMGVDKFRNLILTAREDHNQDSPTHVKGGPKIHFDLSGYDILFWDPKQLDRFRDNLAKRIQRRQAIIAKPTGSADSSLHDEWLNQHRSKAYAGLQRQGLSGYMEVRFILPPLLLLRKNQADLLKVAEAAAIHTFGWPIGVVLHRDDSRPRPTVDGIFAEVVAPEMRSYDYWTIRRDGQFYLLKSLFEDEKQSNIIFFDTRIVRTTEVLLYCARLYSLLGVLNTAVVLVSVRHGGLQGRILSAASGGRRSFVDLTTTENEVMASIQVPLARIESNLVELVKDLTMPLFAIFDFFEPSDEAYEDIVNNFVAGKVV